MKKDTGIILRSLPYKERDRLVFLLSENHGKLTGIARGAIHSKRFGGSFDLGNYVHFQFNEKPGKELVHIESATTKHGFSQMRSSLERIGCATYFIDLCNRSVQHKSPARGIFILLIHYLRLLEAVVPTLSTLRSFEVKLLDRLGYSPAVHKCVLSEEPIALQCSTQERIPFSIEKGGIISHRLKNTLEQSILKKTALTIQAIKATPISEIYKIKIEPKVLQELGPLLQNFHQFHCPNSRKHYLSSRDFAESLLALPKAQSTASPKSLAT